MEYWPEFKAACLVGRLGTVSAAAQAYGVHRATIIRHIDALEGALGVKLFHRHRRGYTPTDIGAEFMKTASTIADDYNSLLGNIQNRAFEVSGEVSVCAAGPLSPFIVKASQVFQERFPNCGISFTATEQFPELELAEAHIVLWAGEQPTVDDYVIVPITVFENHLYASSEYIERYGNPTVDSELSEHRFVCVSAAARSGPSDWLRQYLGNLQGSRPKFIFESNDRSSVFRSVIDGVGIGVLPHHVAQSTPGITKIMPELTVPSVPCWAVTHAAIHRAPKTQGFLAVLKEIGATMFSGEARREPLISV